MKGAGVFLTLSPPPARSSVPAHLSRRAGVHLHHPCLRPRTLIHRPSASRYLGGSSRLGTRSHRFFSAAKSSTDTAEVAAMAPQPGRSPTSGYTSCFPLPACKTFPPLRKPIVLHRPPSRSQSGARPLKRGGGVSVKTNQRTEQDFGGDDWPIVHKPAEVWSLLLLGAAPTEPGVGPHSPKDLRVWLAVSSTRPQGSLVLVGL